MNDYFHIGADTHFNRLFLRYENLECIKTEIADAYHRLIEAFSKNNKLLVCGNGGSASDADHIVGELMKGFYKRRPLPKDVYERIGPKASSLQGALPAISLVHPASLLTAYINDVGPDMMFAQQVYGLGQSGDVFLGISTSGNAENVVNAAEVALAKGLVVLSMTGENGGKLKKISHTCIAVPAMITADIQELHLPVYHTLCAMVEEYFFS